MRRPIQVLVLPYKYASKDVKFLIFKRSDLNVWQGIAGGVEDGESIYQAAKREANEEAGIPITNKFIKLDSKSTIPVNFIHGDFYWGKDVYNAIEYCFGVCINDQNIDLSDEHIEYRWVSYEEAFKLFKWDSNKNALWELNERIKRKIK